jgi:anti-sigma regulatory factor (Ser/Thr protein kinase)
MDDTLSTEMVAALSENVGRSLEEHNYSKADANRASLFVEEIVLTLIERNKNAKKPVLVEISLFFDSDSVLLIERDSGELFDLTDPDLQIKGISGFILSGLMESHKEKAYLVTTGYNRNMIRFNRSEA